MSSFTNKKELRFIVTLGKGTFGSSGVNQVTLEGYRASVVVDKAGGAQMSTLRAQIWGVSQADMNSITTLQWKPGDQISNTVEVYAIDGAQQTLVFSGYIVNAWGNYQSMPAVFLEIQAQHAYLGQLTPVAPRSYKGQIDVASVMSQIAASLGFTFENNGVTTQLSNTYLANTGVEQAKALARAAGISLYMDDLVLAITPANTPRGGTIPQISSTTGMMGYPTFDGIGVTIKSLFNPSVKFGGSIQVLSSIPQAAGQWIVVSLSYRLESEKDRGAWEMTMRGNKNGLAIVS